MFIDRVTPFVCTERTSDNGIVLVILPDAQPIEAQATAAKLNRHPAQIVHRTGTIQRYPHYMQSAELLVELMGIFFTLAERFDLVDKLLPGLVLESLVVHCWFFLNLR